MGKDALARQSALRALAAYNDPRIANGLARLLANPDLTHPDRGRLRAGPCVETDARSNRCWHWRNSPPPPSNSLPLPGLGYCRNPRALNALLAALSNPAQRSVVLIALRRQGPAAINALTRRAAVAGQLPDRLAAYDALCEIADPRGIDVFLSALQSDNLALISGVLASMTRNRRSYDEYQIRDLLSGVGAPIAFVLPTRSLARSWLADPRITDTLLALLQHGRVAAYPVIQALQSMGPDYNGKVVQALMPYLAGNDQQLRLLAIATVGEVGYDRVGQAQRLLTMLLRDRDPLINKAAYRALPPVAQHH